jgi:hypothetical protein
MNHRLRIILIGKYRELFLQPDHFITMKILCIFLVVELLLLSCNPGHSPIVDQNFIDSLIDHYSASTLAKSNELELRFWKNKVDTEGPGSQDQQGYARALVVRFHLFGDINDLVLADSLVRAVSQKAGIGGSEIWLTLAGYNLLFKNYQKAKECTILARLNDQLTLDQQKELLSIQFDIYFESGRFDSAAQILSDLHANSDYNYYFKVSKMDASRGKTDSAIAHLMKAAELAKTNDYQKLLALSGAADLFVSHGDWEQANELFRACIFLNPADYHSILGLGWIALIKDHNDSLSERIFEFVRAKFKVPDPLFRLSQVEELQKNLDGSNRFAVSFVRQIAGKRYGNRYNLNLIELYTGRLSDPTRAEAIAAAEMANRTSPQSFAWFAWTLFKNNKKNLAFHIYETQVRGKPLNALESYWMGKLLQAFHQDEEARSLFESAFKFRFDFDPAEQADLDKFLKKMP